MSLMTKLVSQICRGKRSSMSRLEGLISYVSNTYMHAYIHTYIQASCMHELIWMHASEMHLHISDERLV